MTDREKAIVMAYTGVAMLEGEKFNIFHKYVEEICGLPVFTHELSTMHQQIKEKSKQDFLNLCSRENAVQIDLDGYEPVLDMNMDLLSLWGMRFLATIGAVSEVVGRINIIRLNLLERYFHKGDKKEGKNEYSSDETRDLDSLSSMDTGESDAGESDCCDLPLTSIQGEV